VTTIAKMLEQQRAAIHAMQGRLGARQRRIVGEAMVGLAGDLKRLRPGTWSFTAKTVTMRLITKAFVDLSGKQIKSHGDSTQDVAKMSTGLTARWLNELDKRHRAGQVKPLRFDTLSWWSRKADETNRARLRMYGDSFRRYGAKSVAAIENEIGRVVLLNEPWEKARAKVWAATRKVVDGNQWMVDRIIRTEVSAVHNGIALEALREEDDDPKDPMFKVLIATFDKKTGQDSIFVHGQRKRLDEPFQDDSGRLYMAPPNRPHDREVVTGWRSSYGPYEAAKAPARLPETRKRAKERPPQATTPQIQGLEALRAARTADIEAARRALVPPLAIAGTPEQIAASIDLNNATRQRVRLLQAERKQIADSIARLRREAGSMAVRARQLAAQQAEEAKAVVAPKPKATAKSAKPKATPKPAPAKKAKKQALKMSKEDATEGLRKELDRDLGQRNDLLDAIGEKLGPNAKAEIATLRERQAKAAKGKQYVTPGGRVVTDPANSRAQRDAWIASLTEDERKAVYDWSSEQWFRTIRSVDSGRGADVSVRAMKATGKLEASAINEAKIMLEAERKLAAFREALAKAPRFEGQVSRGLRDMPKDSALRMALDTPGAVIELDAVSSWSADEWEARGFAADGEGSYLLRVVTKRGAVISDERAVVLAAESEIMIDKGARYRVVTSSLRKGDEHRKLVILEEID
jgi:hypothetical protein